MIKFQYSGSTYIAGRKDLENHVLKVRRRLHNLNLHGDCTRLI